MAGPNVTEKLIWGLRTDHCTWQHGDKWREWFQWRGGDQKSDSGFKESSKREVRDSMYRQFFPVLI